MQNLPDLDLRPSDGEPPAPPPPPGPPRSRAAWAWVAGLVLVVAAAVGGYLAFRSPPPPRPAAPPPAAAAPAPVTPPPNLGGLPEQVDVPPLDESDAVVRMLVRALTKHPAVETWLATRGLVRNFVVVVANIADGASPSRHLPAFQPRQGFRVTTRDGATVIDSRSYERWNRIGDAVAAVDAPGAARLYATLKPRIEEASRDLGQPGSFDRTLERAIGVLLRVPVVDGPVRVVSTDKGYVYDEARLEGLSAAQKQLLRMGPRNVRLIQKELRDIAQALGIAASALPPAP